MTLRIKSPHGNVLGCCGYLTGGDSRTGFVSSMLLEATTEKEIDEIFAACDEQDKQLPKEMASIRWKLKLKDNLFYAAYHLPTNRPNVALEAEPDVLQRRDGSCNEHDNKHYYAWEIKYGEIINPLPLCKKVNKLPMFNTLHESVYQIKGFGQSEYEYKNQLKAFLKSNTAIAGVTFMGAQWVEKACQKLHEQFEILLDVKWHNPRYPAQPGSPMADHDLRTVFFRKKEK